MVRTLLICLLLAVPATASGQRQRLEPIDQCASDASFAAFRSELLAAIERRDAAFILASVADDISVDFGGGSGRDDFRRAWGLDRPEGSDLWRELGAALRLGCARDGESLWAPSLFRQLEHEDDPTGVVVAIGAGGVLRAAPSDAAPAIAQLDWDVLAWRSAESPEDWLPVALADGRSGFVRRGQVRGLLDYRAGFARVGGRWRMTVFIAGD